MITLLTPEIIRSDSKQAETEQRARIRDLSIEEERLVKSINTLRTDEEETKKRVREDIATFRNEAQVEIHRISLEVIEKEKEVDALEARRAEAMKPIELVRQEADERNEKSKQREEAINAREKALADKEEAFTSRLEKLHDDIQLNDERAEELDRREAGIKAEELALKDNAQGLADRWVQFHAAVAEKDKHYIDRENAVQAGEKANLIRSQELDKKDLEYKEKDREIKDRYATLERATVEIRGY